MAQIIFFFTKISNPNKVLRKDMLNLRVDIGNKIVVMHDIGMNKNPL